jgi:predicted O-methyltransferase YrrM
LKKLGGGKVWSVDHDEHFAESSRQAVQTHGLQDYVTITHVPLGMHTFSGRPALWYDPKCLIGLPQIDMVIVDGPPSHMGEMMRYPALPVLHSLLSQEAVLILDDASREQERKVVRAWLQEFPDFQFEWIDTEKGTAILWRRPDRAVGGA